MKLHGVATRSATSRFSLPALTILTLVGLLSAHQAYAIDPQLVCSDTEDPSKSFCRDVDISQWRWTSSLDLAGYGPFSSESDAINRVIPIFVNGQPTGWCSMTPTGVTHDVSTASYTAGIDSQHVHRVDYDTVVFNNSNCQSTLSTWAALTQSRDISCPAPLNNGEWGWTLVYEAGNPNTPYCAMPWTKVHKVLGGMCKGNPCDPLTGVKKQLEIDYVGSGSSPLRFSRQYLSSAAYEEATHTPALHSVLGHGWTANYFQSIAFSATGPRQVAVARRPNGEVRTFRKSGASFIAELDANERLVRFIDGGGNTTGWQLTTQQDDVELYDAQGRLSCAANHLMRARMMG